MPWCPKCKTEYIDGVTVCSDCHSVLTDSLEKTEQMNQGDEQMERWYPREEITAEEEAQNARQFAVIYEDKGVKAKESMSSAWMLFVIGGGGLAAVLLIFLGVIPLYQDSANRLFVCGGMAAFFLLLIGLGISSVKLSKKQAVQAEKEKNVTKEIKEWCEKSFFAEDIDAKIPEFEAEEAEELKYYQRITWMKTQIVENFYGLEEDFLDHLIDEVYIELYDKGNS